MLSRHLNTYKPSRYMRNISSWRTHVLEKERRKQSFLLAASRAGNVVLRNVCCSAKCLYDILSYLLRMTF